MLQQALDAVLRKLKDVEVDVEGAADLEPDWAGRDEAFGGWEGHEIENDDDDVVELRDAQPLPDKSRQPSLKDVSF